MTFNESFDKQFYLALKKCGGFFSPYPDAFKLLDMCINNIQELDNLKYKKLCLLASELELYRKRSIFSYSVEQLRVLNKLIYIYICEMTISISRH